MTDKVRYVSMEVETFDKTLEECETFEEKFLFFMKNLPTCADKPDTHNDQYFEELLMEAEYLKMDNETQAQYERRVMQIWDNKNVEDYMIKTTLAEGRAEAVRSIVLNMLERGCTVEEICRLTGLSEEELTAVKG